jgi:hypothetical protein
VAADINVWLNRAVILEGPVQKTQRAGDAEDVGRNLRPPFALPSVEFSLNVMHKERPGDVVVNRTAGAPAVLDRRSTRQPGQCAGRDEKMLAAEPKDGLKEEDRMPST